MQEQLKQLEKEAVAKVEAAQSLKEVNDVRVAYLGKKGPITEVLRGMGKLSAEERPKMGALANEVRETIAAAIAEKTHVLKKKRSKESSKVKRSMLRFREIPSKRAQSIR